MAQKPHHRFLPAVSRSNCTKVRPLAAWGPTVGGTLGQWRGERLKSDESRIHGAAGALSFKREGQRVFTESGLLIVGLIFYGGLVAIIIHFVAYQCSVKALNLCRVCL